MDKMDYRMFRRKYLLGCFGKLSEDRKDEKLISLLENCRDIVQNGTEK